MKQVNIQVSLALIALIAVILAIQPAAAANNSITIGYSGSGGSYIGDMIFFSGKFSGGDTVELCISGPGLPSGGVPVTNLNGEAGTGTPIQVGPDGSWKFLWYSASAQGIERLQTVRYTFTVQDPAHPNVSASTSMVLKKPEFSATITPNPSIYAEYVAIAGTAEKDTGSVRIAVTDDKGTIYHTFMAPVGADGSFNFGFHGDMQPGGYVVTVTYPSKRSTLSVPLTVVSSRSSANATAGTTPGSLPGQENGTPGLIPGTGSISVVTTPSNASVTIDSAMAGYSPLVVNNVAPGSHRVAIALPGYLPYSAEVTVSESSTSNLTPALIRSLSFAPLSPATAILALSIAGFFLIFFSSRKRN